MDFVEIIFSFCFGSALGAVIVSALWYLRERERARAFQTLHQANEMLLARERRQTRVINYVRDGLREMRGRREEGAAATKHTRPIPRLLKRVS
jgi:hypothetical protein